ncbi:MAG: bifunctional salicylyl-CoA 5-hydroxylase/oxidoreductase [Planctomycetota bacterium]
MRIATIGGGPAALYFAILMKKQAPDVRIRIHERNRADDTFGWGVVFSDETLGNFEAADPETYHAITARFRYWSDIETWFGGTVTTSTGHGFCGLARKELLEILQARARALGVELAYETDIEDPRSLADWDLLIGADGVNSRVRETWAEHFKPELDWRKCKFSWLGTDKELEAFTFIFTENEHGLFQVHAYPFTKGLSTWIVECREETWRRAGLDRADEAETVRYCEKLFAPWLDGHRLLSNRSIWRTFPTITNQTWCHENVVLLGDSAHTAHFSIGSGTKLAMEDAIALADAFSACGTDDVPAALRHYEEARRIDVLKVQKAAQTSLEWFENSQRYLGQDPTSFAFNLMTRSKRITWDNLSERDPALVDATRQVFAEAAGAPRDSRGDLPVPIFTPYRVGDLELKNRIVVSPMCQYSAVDGVPTDWHLVHLGGRAIGGAGLVITEMTNVTPEGRITPGCAGIWNDRQTEAWARIVSFCHENSDAKMAMQIAHAGRKGSVAHPWEGAEDIPLPDELAWETLAPSSLPFHPHWRKPREMTRADMDTLRDAFADGARRAAEAGFDMIELHMAHGYLLSSFLSPLSNRREDEYGGSLENRLRYPLEVLRAVRAAWPAERPIAVRISATDWLGDEGLQEEDAVVIARALGEEGCDLLDVSTAGNSPRSRPVYGRMYQVPFAERIRYETGLPVMAVGAIQGADHANTVLAAGRADLCALARPHLANPYLTLEASTTYSFPDQRWPGQYLAGRPRQEADRD